MKPTQKQIAARKRNWQLCALKGALLVIKPYVLTSTLKFIESTARRKIDEQWQAEK